MTKLWEHNQHMQTTNRCVEVKCILLQKLSPSIVRFITNEFLVPQMTESQVEVNIGMHYAALDM